MRLLRKNTLRFQEKQVLFIRVIFVIGLLINAALCFTQRYDLALCSCSAKLVGVPSRLQRLGGIFRFIEVKLGQLLPLPKSVCNVSTSLYKWREFFTEGMLQFLTEMQAKLMNSLGAM